MLVGRPQSHIWDIGLIVIDVYTATRIASVRSANTFILLINYYSNMELAPAAAVDPNVDDLLFQACLREVLRFTERQVNALIADGYERATDLAFWSYEDITKWVVHKEKLRNNAGGASFGDMRKKSLIGLAWWVTERVRTGLPVDVTQFDDDARSASIIEARVEHDEGKSESQVDKPDKFKYEEWTEWEKSVYTYLLSTKNSLGIPLAYVIRKDSMYLEMDDRTSLVVRNASLEGAVFRNDSMKVLSLLKSLTTGTDAENWMKGKTCGRLAMQAIQAHYDGDAEAEKRKEAARSDLKVLHYRHEASMSFEKYINRLKKCFDTLEKYGVPYYEEDKVKLLLDRIQCNHGEVKTQVSICRASYASDFVQASTYMSREISRIFPNLNVASISFGKGKNKGRNVSSITGKGKREGKKGKRNRGKVLNNGVDISDHTRYYSKEEWAKLDSDVRKKILDDPERQKLKKQKNDRNINAVNTNSGGSGGSEAASVMSKESEDRMVAAILRGVMQSSQEDDTNSGRSIQQAAISPRHGGRLISGGQSVSSVRSGVTFDRSVTGGSRQG